MASFQCEECGETFPKLSQLLQHRRAKNHWKKYTCSSCKKTFNRKDNLDRHMKKHADENNHHCPECLKVFTREDALDQHLHREHGWGAKKRSADQEGGSAAKIQRAINDPTDMYTINKISDRKLEKFRTTASYYKISVNSLEIRELQNILKILRKIFQSILDTMIGRLPFTDLVRVSIDNPQLDFPIVLPFMRRSELTVDRLLSEIERVLQSYEEFILDETFGMELVHVQNPNGSGNERKPYVNISRMLNSKSSIIQIRSNDELCCARALVTAVARIENHPQWDSIRKGTQLQRNLAVNLHQKAHIPLQKCGLKEINQFQAVLSDYQIHVLSKEHFNAIIYEGPDGGKPLYLYLHDNHFDVITTMTGFLNRCYFCETCKKGYNTKERHACNNPCIYCHHLHQDETENWISCDKCNRYFKNDTCFEMHLKKQEGGKCTCEIYYKCSICNQTVNMNRHKKPHQCNETYCKTCKDFFEEGHQCYMQPAEIGKCQNGQMKNKESVAYIFFDFECTQDDINQCEGGFVPDERGKCKHCKKSWCGTFEHRPNLCVAQKVCGSCLYTPITSTSECKVCGKNERVFQSIQACHEFCQWLFSEENAGATVICHNFKGYDSYPILQYLHDNAIIPEVITNGSKYMSIQVPHCKIRMIDSLNFIPMPLADMPASFGETEIAKGYFPHLFNRKENQKAILTHLPELHYYTPDCMKPNARELFLQWYEQNKNNHFNFQEELLKYCRSDVDILRKCVLKFRQLFLELTRHGDSAGIDPFEKCITIASACNLVYRTNFLLNESIAVIPPHGYRPEEKQSVMAYQWLTYLAHTKNIYIQHGRNVGEKDIGPYQVDGYYESDEGKKIVLEFHGCFWHGCRRCYSHSTINPVSELSMGDLYARTMEKKQFIEDNGYMYESVWECDFRRELDTNVEMKSFVQSLEMVSPLEPRDAFFGGRTEGFKLYEEATVVKQIKYYDVTSLYPWVNKTGKVPIGHPHIITENFDDINKYEGLIKCKILAPKGLYIPVLPTKCNGKLLFSLCRTCSETFQQSQCMHDINERAFTGTWVTDEMKEALAQGYKILKIYEVWHFEKISQYDPVTKSEGLFTDYVNTFLKVKQEASGWPDWCQAEEGKLQYIQQYHAKEGILLDYHKIKNNPGLRSLAKLMLNSFWGKFGQRTNLTQTTYVSKPCDFFDMMTSDQQQIKNVRFVNNESVQIDWMYQDNFITPSTRTNVVIAAYTTAQARLKLYSYLRPLGRRVLYCDTDSVVFATEPEEWEPRLGDYLGDLTDEVSNNAITKFVTGGPKNYAYTLKKPNKCGQTSICKVRGITLNFKNLLDINFKTIHDMVTSNTSLDKIAVVDNYKITRNQATGQLITKREIKDYRVVFDKRVIDNNYITYPYGY